MNFAQGAVQHLGVPEALHHASGWDEHLALHAPALTMALLLEGCCSRSASAAVSMAHVTLARVSAVWGRCASGTAVGGRSSDCCIAALMRAEGSYHSFKIERKSLSGCRSAHAFITTPWGEK